VDPAQTVVAPHGAAAVFYGHGGTVGSVPEDGTKPVAQIAGETPVVIRGSRIYIHLPLGAAAIFAGGGNTVEAGIILRCKKFHKVTFLRKNGRHWVARFGKDVPNKGDGFFGSGDRPSLRMTRKE
jgi:hypothetical protein